MLSGTIRLYDGKRWIDGTPGDFLFVPEGGIHAFKNESGKPASMLILFAPGAPREDYFETTARTAAGLVMSEGREDRVLPAARHVLGLTAGSTELRTSDRASQGAIEECPGGARNLGGRHVGRVGELVDAADERRTRRVEPQDLGSFPEAGRRVPPARHEGCDDVGIEPAGQVQAGNEVSCGSAGHRSPSADIPGRRFVEGGEQAVDHRPAPFRLVDLRAHPLAGRVAAISEGQPVAAAAHLRQLARASSQEGAA
jgi:hypothetical protein